MALPNDISKIGQIANAVYNSVTANATAITALSINNNSVYPSTGGFRRNRIINGAMQIAQRATTATGTYNSVYVYASVDRWAVFSINSSTTQAQSTDVPSGFLNSFKSQRPASNTGTNPIFFIQGIEAANCYDLSGQQVTLSFWAKRGANYSGGNLTVSLITGTTADQGIAGVGSWAGRATPISTTAAITTTWTLYTFTGTVGSGVLEASVEFSWTPSGTAGADDSVYITGVQLEAGSSATPFERLPIGETLMLCQRYATVLPNSGAFGPSGSLYSTTGGVVFFKFPVTMRATPTLSGTSNAFEIFGSGAVTGTVANTSFNAQGVKFDGTSLSSPGLFGQPLGYGGSGFLSAEL
jgi:hypothetical protein